MAQATLADLVDVTVRKPSETAEQHRERAADSLAEIGAQLTAQAAEVISQTMDVVSATMLAAASAAAMAVKVRKGDIDPSRLPLPPEVFTRVAADRDRAASAETAKVGQYL